MATGARRGKKRALTNGMYRWRRVPPVIYRQPVVKSSPSAFRAGRGVHGRHDARRRWSLFIWQRYRIARLPLWAEGRTWFVARRFLQLLSSLSAYGQGSWCLPLRHCISSTSLLLFGCYNGRRRGGIVISTAVFSVPHSSHVPPHTVPLLPSPALASPPPFFPPPFPLCMRGIG